MKRKQVTTKSHSLLPLGLLSVKIKSASSLKGNGDSAQMEPIPKQSRDTPMGNIRNQVSRGKFRLKDLRPNHGKTIMI